jgi:hypothetical protein
MSGRPKSEKRKSVNGRSVEVKDGITRPKVIPLSVDLLETCRCAHPPDTQLLRLDSSIKCTKLNVVLHLI